MTCDLASGNGPSKFARLQIGMSTPGALPDEALQVFFDSTWINLGDPPAKLTAHIAVPSSWLNQGKQSLRRLARRLSTAYDQRCRVGDELRGSRMRKVQALEQSSYLRPFWWTIDGRLDFSDGVFSFVFSEHFFEHIWPDEAYALFRECFRILRPGGVLRASVPDADLRIYEPPEPFAFDTATLTSSNRGWQHPEIHKTRWNVYLLTLLLSQAGFRVRPIVYCDKEQRYFREWPKKGDGDYAGDADWEVLTSSLYVIRKHNSLIVDAIKSSTPIAVNRAADTTQDTSD